MRPWYKLGGGVQKFNVYFYINICRILKQNPDALYCTIKHGAVIKRKKSPSNANYQVTGKIIRYDLYTGCPKKHDSW